MHKTTYPNLATKNKKVKTFKHPSMVVKGKVWPNSMKQPLFNINTHVAFNLMSTRNQLSDG
jgi:hypothetical protein